MPEFQKEILKIWSRVNEAMGKGEFGRADSEMDTLLTNVRPMLGDEKEQELDEFTQELQTKYNNSVEQINEDTGDLKPMDRNQIRAQRYQRLEVWRVKQLHKFLNNLIHEEGLIPGGGLE